MSASGTPLSDGIPEPWATVWGRDRYGVFMAFSVRGVTQRLRWIPPGRFRMGSPEGEDGRFRDDGPRHGVELTSGYWLGETPVTQGLWEVVAGTNPSRFKGADRPVEQVNWDECVAFMGALETQVPGLGARLPTEAEWERACRGDTEGATWLGSNDEETLNAIAWWGGNSRGETHPVRQKAPNPYGLYDMLGNVWEWCADHDLRRYNAGSMGDLSLLRDPYEHGDGPDRVYRGGSWLSPSWFVRAAYRTETLALRRDNSLGFRLARGQVLRSGPSR